MTSRLSQLGKKEAPAESDAGLDFGDSGGSAAGNGGHGGNGNSAAVEWPQIEVEAVIGGCLMRLHIADMSPAQVLPYLKGLDPGCKVRDDFPKGGAGFGKRDTKRARLTTILYMASEYRVDVSLVGKDGEADVSIKVLPKKAPEFVSLLIATGRLLDEHVERLQNAAAAKKQAVVVLTAREAVDAEYWTGNDGAVFLEALHAAAEA